MKSTKIFSQLNMFGMLKEDGLCDCKVSLPYKLDIDLNLLQHASFPPSGVQRSQQSNNDDNSQSSFAGS